MAQTMRLLIVYRAPLWQEADGRRTVGIEEVRDQLPVVGWCSAALIQIGGRSRWFYLADPSPYGL